METKSVSRFEWSIKQFVGGWTAFEKVWLCLFTAANLYVYAALDQTALGLAASLTGMLTVVLVARGRLSNYLFGFVNSVLYGLLAFQSQYYGEVMLNWGYFVPAQFVGVYLWQKNMDPSGVVRAVGFGRRARVVGGVAIVGAIGGYALFLNYLNGNLPLFDATSTVLSVVAMLLMIKRATEQWLVWLVIDVVSIYMWATTYLAEGYGLSMVVMWTAYLVNACYGWYNWRGMEADG